MLAACPAYHTLLLCQHASVSFISYHRKGSRAEPVFETLISFGGDPNLWRGHVFAFRCQNTI